MGIVLKDVLRHISLRRHPRWEATKIMKNEAVTTEYYYYYYHFRLRQIEFLSLEACE